MHASSIPTTPRATPRRPIARAALTGIAFALISAASGSALAQSPQTLQAAATPSARAESAPAPGRTRAEVIAELECARASGELAAAVLQSYGLSMTPQPSAAACGDRVPAAIASRPPSTAKN